MVLVSQPQKPSPVFTKELQKQTGSKQACQFAMEAADQLSLYLVLNFFSKDMKMSIQYHLSLLLTKAVVRR